MVYFDDLSKIRRKFIHYYKKKNYANCIMTGQKLIALYKKNGDVSNIDYADDLYNLACAYYESGSYSQSKTLYIDSIKIVRKLLGKGASYADRLNNIALCCVKLNELSFAEKYLKEAAVISSENGQEYSEKHLDCLYNLANVHYDLCDYDNAIKQHVTVLFNRKAENDAYTDSLNCIGYAYEKLGDMENSINYMKRATANIKKLHGTNSEAYLANIYYIAHMYSKKEDFGMAVKSYEEAKSIINKVYSEKHPYYADTLNKLAEALFANGQKEKALELRLDALRIVKEQIGVNHVYYANSLRNIALIYKSEGNEEKSIEYFSRALEIKADIVGKNSIDYIKDVMLLSGMYIERYEYDRAMSLLNATLEELKKDGEEFANIIPEINKIFNSIQNIKKIKDTYSNTTEKTSEDKVDIFKLLKVVEDRISRKSKVEEAE